MGVAGRSRTGYWASAAGLLSAAVVYFTPLLWLWAAPESGGGGPCVPISGKALGIALWLTVGLLVALATSVLAAAAATGLALLGLPLRISVGWPVLASLVAVVVVFWPVEQLGDIHDVGEQLGTMLNARETDRKNAEIEAGWAEQAERRAARASEARAAVEDRNLLEVIRQDGKKGEEPLELFRLKQAAKKLAVERLEEGALAGAELRSTILVVFTNGDPPIFQRRGVPHRLRGIAIDQLVAKGEFGTLLDEAPGVVFQLLEDRRGRVTLKGLDEAALKGVTAAAIELSGEETRAGSIARRIAALGRRHLEGDEGDLKDAPGTP